MEHGVGHGLLRAEACRGLQRRPSLAGAAASVGSLQCLDLPKCLEAPKRAKASACSRLPRAFSFTMPSFLQRTFGPIHFTTAISSLIAGALAIYIFASMFVISKDIKNLSCFDSVKKGLQHKVQAIRYASIVMIAVGVAGIVVGVLGLLIPQA